MADLEDILKKTKEKSNKIKRIRLPVGVAVEDRPYDSPNLILKPATKRQQTDNKVATKPETKRQQSGNKLTTKWQQKIKTDNKVATKLATQLATKWQQSGNKVATKMHFSSLVGLQRAIIIFLYQECKKIRGKTTNSITLNHIALCMETSSNSIKTTIQRLETKRCLIRKEYKNGRGGWAKYEIPENIFREIVDYETDNKLTTKWQQTDNKVATKLTTELATTPYSSSIILNNNKTTTTTLPKEWENIDLEPTNHIGFSKTQLEQLYTTNKCHPDVIQESIYHFAFALKNNEKIKAHKNPLNMFMGVLRKGHAWIESGYESPKDSALRKILEQKKAETEKRNAMINELFELEFNKWFGGYSEQELETLYYKLNPTGGFKYQGKDHIPSKSILINYFKTNIWPQKQKDFNLMYEGKKKDE
jgi:hypothetical protein